jgi:hypothetical protein
VSGGPPVTRRSMPQTTCRVARPLPGKGTGYPAPSPQLRT